MAAALRRLPSWLPCYGRRIAVLGLLVQLTLSVSLPRVVTGLLLVTVAWMTVGSVFAACINAWPYLAIRYAWLAGLAGVVSLGFAWF